MRHWEVASPTGHVIVKPHHNHPGHNDQSRKSWKYNKQKSIPVGCVPPAFVIRGGGSLVPCPFHGVYPTPPDTLHSLGYPRPWIPYPWYPTSQYPTPIPYPFPDTLPPPKGHGTTDQKGTWHQRYPTTPWTEWQTPVKTLPSLNFVGGR